VGTFLSRAENILEVAIATSVAGSSDVAIVILHDGGMRIFDGAGWGLAGLLAEYGAREVYRVERRGSRVRVAGQSASQTCRLERELETHQYYPSVRRPVGYAVKSHDMPLAIAGSNEWSPQVLNS
jgi:hypothetical protein